MQKLSRSEYPLKKLNWYRIQLQYSVFLSTARAFVDCHVDIAIVNQLEIDGRKFRAVSVLKITAIVLHAAAYAQYFGILGLTRP